MIRVEATSEADVTRMLAAFQVLPALRDCDYEVFLVTGFSTAGRPGSARAWRIGGQRGGANPDEQAKVFYVLICRLCGDPDKPLPMPFESPAERGKWAAAHTAGTGHDSWFVIDQTEDGP